jgi:hypothetical protein
MEGPDALVVRLHLPFLCAERKMSAWVLPYLLVLVYEDEVRTAAREVRADGGFCCCWRGMPVECTAWFVCVGGGVGIYSQ